MPNDKKKRRIDFRWLNVDRAEFQTRAQIEAYAQKRTGGVWQANVDEGFNPGILIAYGQRTYSRRTLLELDKRLRQQA